ncbi:uncharacterized protein NECHADRAFT_75670 [Fusarium vanettenii 77-13-4]|uniref:Uncharacterized protein n=1 Tax=Fusarium vanettenii (strain ATCC MYA-4622 / CBS 123669 / FGSC 9596 / NRRL 45880 / 77-13-4) TaxID=660122 RepID=C7YJG5_FUSV7|nr:uncharacterized protein NECHADRAFT_75670 [Fusarium vanettenii 77-13-4]EEU48274.1 predicted protein [Fusarium vanettenii 77-13-4]
MLIGDDLLLNSDMFRLTQFKTDTTSQLPKDAVALHSGDKAYLFYLNSERELTYLRRIEDEHGDDIVVNEKPTQIAAIRRTNPAASASCASASTTSAKGNHSEVCWSSKGPKRRFQGSLGMKNKVPHLIANGSPISATAYKRPSTGSTRVLGALSQLATRSTDGKEK